MGHIERPPKSKGTRTYQQEVALGGLDILDSEVDGDFTEVYSLVNGNLDTTNLSNSAAIGYSKLVLTGLVRDTDISLPAAFAGAGINGNKIQPGTLAPGTIQPGTVIITDTGQLAAGAATADVQQVTISAPKVFVNPSAQVMAELTWTCRGPAAFQLVTGLCAGSISSLGAQIEFQLGLVFGGAPGDAASGLPLTAQKVVIGSTGVMPYSLACFFPLTGIAAGVDRMKLVGRVVVGAGTIDVLTGTLAVVELA